AVLLARAGVSVAVLEGRTVSAGTTGASTAKISLLQGTRLSTIGQRQPQEAVRRYVDANRDAQAWLVELCESRGVPLQRVPALTFAVGASGESTAREELEAARSGAAGAVGARRRAAVPDARRRAARRPGADRPRRADDGADRRGPRAGRDRARGGAGARGVRVRPGAAADRRRRGDRRHRGARDRDADPRPRRAVRADGAAALLPRLFPRRPAARRDVPLGGPAVAVAAGRGARRRAAAAGGRRGPRDRPRRRREHPPGPAAGLDRAALAKSAGDARLVGAGPRHRPRAAVRGAPAA